MTMTYVSNETKVLNIWLENYGSMERGSNKGMPLRAFTDTSRPAMHTGHADLINGEVHKSEPWCPEWVRRSQA